MSSLDCLLRSLFRISNNIHDIALRENEFWFVYHTEDRPITPLHSSPHCSHWLPCFENFQERYIMKISEDNLDLAIVFRMGISEIVLCQIRGRKVSV